MTLDFSWIKWAGENCILITDRNSGKPLLILRGYEIRTLEKMFKEVK